MRIELKMPDLAATESEIRIVRWLVQPGEKIERGQMFVEVETDKATMEVESAVRGVLQHILAQPDQSVAVGDVVAVLETEDAPTGTPPPPARPAPMAKTPSAPVTPGDPSAAAKPAGMFARKRAANESNSTGPQQSVTLNVAQRTAARRLQESKQTVPHFYLQTSFDAAAIVRRRTAALPAKLAWDAFFVRAVARALSRFERLSYRLDGECLRKIDSESIGVAVDESGDLYVIPISAPRDKSVEQISEEIRGGLEQLRSGSPEARRIRPALMTITNLGMCNVESFIPIINPPEAAILGIGKAMPVPVADNDGRVAIQQRCTLTLSVDHRVASGRYAGQFLGEVVKELESVEP